MLSNLFKTPNVPAPVSKAPVGSNLCLYAFANCEKAFNSLADCLTLG